jgi:two-component system, NarL family, response regulator LiaR
MDNKGKIRVMIVDDHGVVRRGLGAFLTVYDDLVMCAEAENGAEALQKCVQHQPDVILMDLVMPGMNGAEATHQIKERWPQVQVIVLTSFKEKELVHEALKAGAIGYLLKNVSTEDLAGAIRAAYSGMPTLAPEATQALIQHSIQGEDELEKLTRREMEVLELMVKGLNNTEIAEKLFVSRSTIKFHVSSILSKLHAASRTEAVATAVQNRMVSG